MDPQRIALLIPITVRPSHEELARRDEGPRRDYFELARATRGQIVDETRIAAEGQKVVRLARRWLGTGLAYALWAFLHRDEYDAFYADSERVGLPLAALLKRAGAPNRHVMIGHWLSPLKKRAPLQIFRLHTHIDRIICHVEIQRRVAQEMGVPLAKLTVVPYGVDHHFWRPLSAPAEDLICAAGMEQRDYPTLLDALWGSRVKAVVAAASPWFRNAGLDHRVPLPPNVEVGTFDYGQLRLLYARARFVVVPLLDLDFQAGITTILEAMAMGKAVIVTRTRGQTGTGIVRDGQNGLLVQAGDPQAMREAIDYLWDHPDEATRMGRLGRRLLEEQWTLDQFTSRVAEIINETDR